jgi:tRNA (guanosine-2'-O-)-methyltransferase
MVITDERLKTIKTVVENRQLDFTVILENVHDPHNIGAVLRTCDSVGIHEVYLIYTDKRITTEQINIGRTSSSGANKWVETYQFDNVKTCFEKVRAKYSKIYGTHLSSQSVGLYDLNLTKSVALMFGNEHSGISDEALALLDGNFMIPQLGFVKSLNISVACAISMYEVLRQRMEQNVEVEWSAERNELLDKYINISRPLTRK